jgi:uncharacterized protein YecE (DUF72 family)
MGEIILGTSGWYYKEWVGPFYNDAKRMFSFYAKYFRTAEINSTFYRYPSRRMIYGLYRSSPKDFKFSVKLPKLITHEKKLRLETKVENDLLRFLELLNPLNSSDKLGVILIQLPPSFTFEDRYDDLSQFLKILPENYKFAVEFRNWSWIHKDTWKLLERYNVAYTIVDEPLLPPDIHVTADFSYFRWHGRGEKLWYDHHYKEEELEPWVPRVREVTGKVKKVYGYFNNHFHGYAVENCVQILEMLGTASKEQMRIKDKIIKYNLAKRPKAYQKKLDLFKEKKDVSLDELLLNLMDQDRLDKAKRIKDEELTIINSTNMKFEVKIKQYIVKMDLYNRAIVHNCHDWLKGFPKKRLCKHLAKVFLKLPSGYSIKILKDLLRKREQWRFEIPYSGVST